jgi:hypothetical protein
VVRQRTLGIVIISWLTSALLWPAPAQELVYDTLPARLALYPRDADDSAVVVLSGRVVVGNNDSITLKTYRNNTLTVARSAALAYVNTAAPFRLSCKIHAELSLYKFEVSLKSGAAARLATSIDSVVCGDVYLVDGQSNAAVFPWSDDPRIPYLRSFGRNGSASPADTNWGPAKVDTRDPAAGSIGVGEWPFYVMKGLMDTFGIPLAMINGAEPSTRISEHQRSASNPTDLSTIYGRLLYRARKARVADRVKGVFWFQGEANQNIEWADHHDAFNRLYTSWKTDYPLTQRVYVFQIHPGCVDPAGVGNHAWELREAQRSFADSLPDVSLVSTMGIPGHDGCHYPGWPGYYTIGNSVRRMVARDLYGKAYASDVSPPNLKEAFYTSPARNEIALVFRNGQEVVWQDTMTQAGTRYYLKDYFYLDTVPGRVAGHRISRDTLYLTLSSPSTATRITYLPRTYYEGTTTTYEGPWVWGTNGLGALSFYNVPILEAWTTRVGQPGPSTARRASPGAAARLYALDGRRAGTGAGIQGQPHGVFVKVQIGDRNRSAGVGLDCAP